MDENNIASSFPSLCVNICSEGSSRNGKDIPMSDSEEECMDAFAAECLELYDCGSSIDSSLSNDIVIWSLCGPPFADYKHISDQDSQRYKARLQNHQYLKDAYTVSMGTPMSELLKKNFYPAPADLKQACNKAMETPQNKPVTAVEMKSLEEKEHNSKGGLAGKFMNWLERKITAPSRSFVKNVKLL